MIRHPTGPVEWQDAAQVHGDLRAAKELVYDPCGFACSRPVPEAEGAEYAAHAFTLDGLAVQFRVARTTPTRTGQFVTVWKRSPDGPIQPFDVADAVDLFVVSSRGRGHGEFGQFVLPKDVLRRYGVLSVNGSGGKRAFRVHPPWVSTASRSAAAAQAWQLDHFLHLPGDPPVDPVRARALHGPGVAGHCPGGGGG
ncbi:MepB family protein [Streptomyces sp. NBC_01264]|uniref:MepB family protein n=1 Tax=Streptomyces sp. NBC_01264 TaxID=2903804 RepID=UPI002255F285|nr:MepB family protein [Streptomyces sp. NBC_01264]MCX4782845.1 MepB family protein [Streptomyces sp. NBC_01264]